MPTLSEALAAATKDKLDADAARAANRAIEHTATDVQSIRARIERLAGLLEADPPGLIVRPDVGTLSTTSTAAEQPFTIVDVIEDDGVVLTVGWPRHDQHSAFAGIYIIRQCGRCQRFMAVRVQNVPGAGMPDLTSWLSANTVTEHTRAVACDEPF